MSDHRSDADMAEVGETGNPPTERAPVATWFCRVCGMEAPDYIGAMTWKNRKNTLGRTHGVIALPCGHEQPLDERVGLAGLGWGVPPSVRGPIRTGDA